MLLAEDPGPAGYLWAQFQDRPANWARQASRLLYIQHMAVAPSFRQKGIGSRLLARAIEIARRKGIQRVELDVWSFNSEARRFYASHHFAVFNERMALDLDGTGRITPGNGENL
jgi:ribosomal protein S18 acetylase RimI-like enzyme